MADKSDYYDEEVLKKKLLSEKESDVPSEVPSEDKKIYKHFDKIHTGDILDKLGLNRYCCRRNLISNVDMMKII
jgi:DNA-directed RNA polymerase subunit N (RpoN/RPB10)